MRKALTSRWLMAVLLTGLVLAGGVTLYGKVFPGEAAGAASAGAAGPPGMPPATVAVADVAEYTFEPFMELPGTVESLTDAVIASETSGKITSVIMIGDHVQRGAPVAQIDPTDAREALSQRQAELSKAESQHAYHARIYSIVEGEEDELGYSGVGVAELKSNMDSAAADVERGRIAVRLAETALARTTIRAPFSGTVVRQEIQPGEYAQVGSPILRLVDTEHLEVSVQVPAASVFEIKEDQTLPVTGKSGTVDAGFRTLVPVGDAVSRTMELRADVSGSGMLVGEPVRVRIPVSAPVTALAVPRDAIVLRSNTEYLFVIRDGHAVRQTVETGLSQYDLIEVRGDLSAGDVVVTRGAERLRDGQPVIVDQSRLSSQSEGNAKL